MDDATAAAVKLLELINLGNRSQARRLSDSWPGEFRDRVKKVIHKRMSANTVEGVENFLRRMV